MTRLEQKIADAKNDVQSLRQALLKAESFLDGLKEAKEIFNREAEEKAKNEKSQSDSKGK